VIDAAPSELTVGAAPAASADSGGSR
jgi:hypothetical protein